MLSAVLSKKPDVEEVYSLEYDPYCIKDGLSLAAEKGLDADLVKNLFQSIVEILICYQKERGLLHDE